MKRTLVGALLLLILVGEPTVGVATGLYTAPGFIVLLTMYILLFLFYEALDRKYQLTNLQLILINFAVYSVLTTGLLHGELANYVTTPNESFITTIIRIQAACFPIFTYILLRKFGPKRTKTPSLRTTILLSLGYILLLSPTKIFGIATLLHTLQIAPLQSLIYSTLAVVAVRKAIQLQSHPKYPPFAAKPAVFLAVSLLILASIPVLPAFLLLVVVMPVCTGLILSNPLRAQAKI